jgi:hypothetical protein
MDSPHKTRWASAASPGIAELVNYAESRFGDPHVRVTAKVIDTFRTSEVLTLPLRRMLAIVLTVALIIIVVVTLALLRHYRGRIA